MKRRSLVALRASHNSTRLRYIVTVTEPALERPGHRYDDLGTARLCDEVENDSPSCCAMPAFDRAMRLREHERFERKPVVSHQRVLFERCVRALGRARIELTPGVARPLDEQRRHSRRRRPAEVERHVVEVVAILARRGQELDALEASEVHAETARG